MYLCDLICACVFVFKYLFLIVFYYFMVSGFYLYFYFSCNEYIMCDFFIVFIKNIIF